MDSSNRRPDPEQLLAALLHIEHGMGGAPIAYYLAVELARLAQQAGEVVLAARLNSWREHHQIPPAALAHEIHGPRPVPA